MTEEEKYRENAMLMSVEALIAFVVRLRTQIERLNSGKLLPFNAAPLIKVLTSVEERLDEFMIVITEEFHTKQDYIKDQK